jgi:hypothetical protein
MELSFNVPLRLSDADLDALADAVYARLAKHLQTPVVVEEADPFIAKQDVGPTPSRVSAYDFFQPGSVAKRESAPTPTPVVITKDALRDAARAHASKNDLEKTRKIMGAQRVDDISIESYATVYSELTK